MRMATSAMGVVLLATVAVTGCSGDRVNNGFDNPGPTQAAPSLFGTVPEPDKSTSDAYLTALEAIDPEIVDGNPGRALSRGRNQCDSIRNFPDDRERLIDHVRIRFNSDKHPEGFDREKSAQILDVVRAHLCPS